VPADFRPDAVRDLLGLLRAMYAAERRKNFPRRRRLVALERAARALKDALATAAVHDPGTAPYVRAVGTANAVATRLTDLIEVTDPIEPVLRAAGARVRPRAAKPAQRGVPRWAVGDRRRKGGG
jgi:hypothetical protein